MHRIRIRPDLSGRIRLVDPVPVSPDPDPFFTGSAAGSTGKIREKISAKWRKTVKKCKKKERKSGKKPNYVHATRMPDPLVGVNSVEIEIEALWKQIQTNKCVLSKEIDIMWANSIK